MAVSETILPKKIVRPLYFASFAVAAFLLIVSAWAIMAPLATSIALNGRIVSGHPPFDVQHRYGGQIGEVLVTKHDVVQRGQPLLRFDTALELENLEILMALQTRIQDENTIIAKILEDDIQTDQPTTGSGAQFALRQRQLILQRELLVASTVSLEEQVAALRHKAARDETHLNMLQTRADRQTEFVERGTISRTDDEALRARMLNLESDMLSNAAQLHGLVDQLEQSRKQPDLAAIALQAELSATLSNNNRRLDDLKQNIATIRDQVSRSIVRAPADGVVTDLAFVAEGMYAPRGSTLVSISRPLENPHVAFNVTTELIDQLRPGMSGQLVIPGLPQRQMPRIHVEIEALSPKAEEDETGVPVGYAGLATLEGETIAELQSAFGTEFSLTEDMPVSLMIEGRKTTLADYLISPFWAAFGKALQD